MAAPIAEFLAVLDETLQRYGVPAASVSAVATIGGGARIPLITQRLSEHLRAPVETTPHPQFTAAEGATLIAYRSRVVGTATALTPTAPAAAGATPTIAAADQSSALAWSEDDAGEDVLPYRNATESRPEVHFRHEAWQDEEAPRRGPLVLFGLSAAACRRSPRPCSASPCSATPPPLRSKRRPPRPARPPPPRLRRRPLSQLPRRRRPPK